MTGINFPTTGCWEITSHFDDDAFTFVVWVTPWSSTSVENPNALKTSRGRLLERNRRSDNNFSAPNPAVMKHQRNLLDHLVPLAGNLKAAALVKYDE